MIVDETVEDDDGADKETEEYDAVIEDCSSKTHPFKEERAPPNKEYQDQTQNKHLFHYVRSVSVKNTEYQ